MSHRKIQYTVEIKNTCKNVINDLVIENDGKNLLPAGGDLDVGYLSSASYDMPMTIPDVADISWRDAAGTRHQEQVPLRSLIHLSDYFGHQFRVEYQFCDGELHVVFGKKSGQFEYDRKEIWTNLKAKKGLPG